MSYILKAPLPDAGATEVVGIVERWLGVDWQPAKNGDYVLVVWYEGEKNPQPGTFTKLWVGTTGAEAPEPGLADHIGTAQLLREGEQPYVVHVYAEASPRARLTLGMS